MGGSAAPRAPSRSGGVTDASAFGVAVADEASRSIRAVSLRAGAAAGLILLAFALPAAAQAPGVPATAAPKPAAARPSAANPATPNPVKPKPGANAPAAKMLVEANELVQNDNDKTVTANGNVRIYYKGKTLEADRVVYNKVTKRMVASGNAKLTEADGTIYRGSEFNLTDDFKEGFVNSLRSDTPGPLATHYSAPRMERVGGDTTVFAKGTYTACDTCKDKPDRPPLWRIRATKIIHKNDERMVYYEDPYLEFLGIPVAYTPYMSAPDPTVTKKSGILSPQTFYRSQLGYGIAAPVFWNLAPDYDFTFTPTYYSQQGFFGAAEFRQRFTNGSYYIRAAGINQLNPQAFPDSPYGTGNRRLRGDITTKGEFEINERWKFGWNITVLSDKLFLYDYAIPADTFSTNFFSESISTVYLTGQGDRSYFDLRGYYIQGLAAQDFQPQQPTVHPVLEYNRTFDIDPAKTRGIGGQVEADFNFTSISSAAASYQAVGARTLDTAFGLYDVCNVYRPGTTAGNSCILRGIGGDYSRATAQLSYQRKFTDDLGQVWTPFAFVRANGSTLNLNTTNVYGFSNGTTATSFSNASQTAFLPGGSGTTGYVVPGVGVEYRYPFLTRVPYGSFVLEPIGQIIARPDRVLGTQTLVNIDSQSLVFDSTNLFDWNKYSGYDRFETGLRANYGAQFSLNLDKGGYARFMAGQSAQLAGQNGFATPDAANIGLSSGLDTRRSDYVTGATISPAAFLTVGALARFDTTTLENRRVDVSATTNFGKLVGGVQFASYAAQPVLGYSVRRQGLGLNARYDFAEHYFVNGNITFDMSRYLYPESITGTSTGPFAIAARGLGFGYQDECTTFTVNYTSIYSANGAGSFTPNQIVLVTLQLRTLGALSYSSTTQNTQSIDGVR